MYFFIQQFSEQKIFSAQSNNTNVFEIFSANFHHLKTESATYLHVKSKLMKETFTILNINFQEKVLYFEMFAKPFTKLC